MATGHLTLLQRVEQALQGLALVPAERVFVERITPVDAADCPCINIVPGAARYVTLGGGDAQHGILQADLDISLRIHTTGTPHTAVADPVITQAHTAVMADPSLGGAAIRLLVRSARTTQTVADATPGVFELQYTATALLDERTLALILN